MMLLYAFHLFDGKVHSCWVHRLLPQELKCESDGVLGGKRDREEGKEGGKNKIQRVEHTIITDSSTQQSNEIMNQSMMSGTLNKLLSLKSNSVMFSLLSEEQQNLIDKKIKKLVSDICV